MLSYLYCNAWCSNISPFLLSTETAAKWGLLLLELLPFLAIQKWGHSLCIQLQKKKGKWILSQLQTLKIRDIPTSDGLSKSRESEIKHGACLCLLITKFYLHSITYWTRKQNSFKHLFWNLNYQVVYEWN